jgi:hypothetical protein
MDLPFQLFNFISVCSSGKSPLGWLLMCPFVDDGFSLVDEVIDEVIQSVL